MTSLPSRVCPTHLGIRVDGTLSDHKLHHQISALQGEVVMVRHGDDHLTKDTPNL